MRVSEGPTLRAHTVCLFMGSSRAGHTPGGWNSGWGWGCRGLLGWVPCIWIWVLLVYIKNPPSRSYSARVP